MSQKEGRRGGRPPLGRVLWAVGEASTTVGAVVLLLVVRELWWTNLTARESARREVASLERQWGVGGTPVSAAPGPAASQPSPTTGSGAPSPDTSDDPSPSALPPAGAQAGRQASGARWDLPFAVIRIPRIGVTAPIAEGTGTAEVLGRGDVGHYPQTAQPGRPGNFALAGHRNTHGEPFRHIDRLPPGDTVIVETATARFTYVVEATVPQTYAPDGTVIAPVPYSSVHPGARMTGAGYYITPTTCTPEFTSKYRLVLWGRLRSGDVR